jgi:hypothetical protein
MKAPCLRQIPIVENAHRTRDRVLLEEHTRPHLRTYQLWIPFGHFLRNTVISHHLADLVFGLQVLPARPISFLFLHQPRISPRAEK